MKKSIAPAHAIYTFVLLLIGGIIGYVVCTITTPHDTTTEQRMTNPTGLTNPLLDCSIDEEYWKKDTSKFEDKIQAVIDTEESKKEVDKVSVYYRELNDGQWFDLGDDEKFAPASLYKVPLLIAYFKLAENDTAILKNKIVYQPSNVDAIQNIPPDQRMEPGKEYTVEELLARMILYSDNEASNILDKNISLDVKKQVFKDIGINFNDTDINFITVKDYATFFRLLYNASYLSRTMSEKALKLLTLVDFKEGIVGGVPDTIQVAHKFGERTFSDSNTKQLHDCGIIYYPYHPYLLCTLTKGTDLKEQAATVHNISKAIYSEVDQRYNKKK